MKEKMHKTGVLKLTQFLERWDAQRRPWAIRANLLREQTIASVYDEGRGEEGKRGNWGRAPETPSKPRS